MNQVFAKNWDKSKYLIISSILISLVLLLAVVYKSDQRITDKSTTTEVAYDNADLKSFKNRGSITLKIFFSDV